jgi:hypothetical protein
MNTAAPRVFLSAASALLLAAAMPPSVRAADAIPGVEFVADVPLLESDGMPCVEATMGGGAPQLFGIDTGDVTMAIDLGAAKAAGSKLEAIPPPVPAGLFKGTIPAIRFGGLVFEGKHALVMDFVAQKMPKVTGTLPYELFKDRILQLDFVAHRVRVSALMTAPAALPGKTSTFSLITFGKQGPPIVVVNGFGLGTMAVTAQLDTMYTGSLLVYTQSIGKLGLGVLADAAKPEFFPYTDGGVTMKYVAVPLESYQGTALGGQSPRLYFPTPGVHEPDGLFDATVGLALLKDTVLTLDFHDSTLSVVRPCA